MTIWGAAPDPATGPQRGPKRTPGRGDVEIATRPAGASRPVDRGRDTPWTTLPGCPPAAPTPAHRLPGLPHISTATRPVGANTSNTFEIFKTLSPGLSALRASLAENSRTRWGTGGPFIPAEPKGEGEPAKGRGNPAGVPRGVDGAAEGRTGGRHAPAPWGAYRPPSGGLLWREGEPPEGWGNPLRGCPAKRSRTRENCSIDRSRRENF